MRALSLFVLLLPFALARCTCAVTPVPGATDAGPDSGPDDAGLGPQDAFDVWREMQDVLRQSDDHRIAKAERLVAARDADALFAFVQHEIALIPGPGGFYGSDVARRWGTRGTLRGGMGTMRERADLLAELLTRAGFTARVMVGVPRADFSLEESLAQGPVRAVSWVASAAKRNTWRSVLNTAPPDTDRVRFDPGAVTQQQIADALLALLPTPRADAGLDLTVAAIPLVRLTRDGVPTDLNANVVNATAADPQVNDIVDAADAWPTEQLTVRLEAARSHAPAERFVLVEHTWNAEDVVGRTITAAFAPPMSFAQAAVTPLADVDTVVPYLLVKGADVPRADRAALSAVGTPITRGGETVAVADTGILNFGDGDITPPPTAATQLAAAQTVTARVDAATFPVVQVAARVHDVGGVRVSGLAADAFTVQEDGVAVAAAVPCLAQV